MLGGRWPSVTPDQLKPYRPLPTKHTPQTPRPPASGFVLWRNRDLPTWSRRKWQLTGLGSRNLNVRDEAHCCYSMKEDEGLRWVRASRSTPPVEGPRSVNIFTFPEVAEQHSYEAVRSGKPMPIAVFPFLFVLARSRQFLS